ncbi:uncharacterized protein F4807DRAFT_463415 [Annulohypoxylon truncatum]|uniref:uncharacterized protein n=1 Tax=Annulohypoxylon truncatum TaxID=327061 RepID=UPI0020077613|nr:uncharacterized protein F4807DRAFT_463415 [Annulohypoxylon truncatum]KAI1206727.1 hypothetical protein F4807DRAFT_463415 [Annulohypoxylon truncatum]
MSQSQNGRNNGRPPGMGGSVKRARELAEAGAPRRNISAFPEPPIRRPQAPPGMQFRDGQGQIGMAISRPTPLPQWPLGGPISAPPAADSEPYRPPPGRSQPPQRPPRPSRVPSILDGSHLQEPTPIFQSIPQNARESELSAPDTIQSTSSRQSTNSSVGTIPDFPLPVAAPPLPPPSRRSVNLGPPPSSRRGASSFYSTASFVSPIPEESPRTRSHTSYASSAAIPESFGSLSPVVYSPNAASIDSTIAEESVISDDADDSRLVSSASIGKRGRPALVTTGSAEKRDSTSRPAPMPIQGGPFRDGTGYIDGSSSSSGNVSREAVGTALTADNMLSAFEGASAMDPSSIRRATPSPRPARFSAIRRPPRLDMDAVRAAEARGSLTSLPDLIRRATRLAALMERGRRPASRFDELDFPEEVYGNEADKDPSYETRHQSGLSDMLAAFPPPASRNGKRQSRASTAWPLGRRSFRGPPASTEQTVDSETGSKKKKKRRCCGLPFWTCFVLLIILLVIIAAAVVIPVKLLVIDKSAAKSTAQPDISDCEAQLTCANGGTNIDLQGVCSCICSNGFTGATCTIPTSQGCTTTSISTSGSNINNVTIGQAIPRLIQNAQTNFSVPLIATVIQSKFNKENLSCNTENALVTFDGQSLRTQDASAEVSDLSSDSELAQAAVVAAAVPITLSVSPDIDITLTIDNPEGTGGFSGSFIVTTLTAPTTISGSTIFATTISGSSNSKRSSPTPVPTSAPAITSELTTSSISPSTTAMPTSTFKVTEEIADFARVAVLYIFQEKTLADASTAQTSVQSFFSSVESDRNTTSYVTTNQATNVTVGGGNTIDFVNLFVDVGAGRVGGRTG